VVELGVVFLTRRGDLGALFEHRVRLVIELQRQVHFGERRIEKRLRRVVLDGLGVVFESRLIVPGPFIGLADQMVTLGQVRILFDTLLERFLGLLVGIGVTVFGLLDDGVTALEPVVGEIRRDLHGARQRRRHLVPILFLLVRAR